MTTEQLDKEIALAQIRVDRQIHKMGDYYISKWRSEWKLEKLCRVFNETGNLVQTSDDDNFRRVDPRPDNWDWEKEKEYDYNIRRYTSNTNFQRWTNPSIEEINDTLSR